LAQAALQHPFVVHRIGDSTLPLESFQSYVSQDPFFLESFARAYALALARSPDRVSMRDLADHLIDGVSEDLEPHGSYAGKWGVQLDDVVPVEATLAYTDFLLSTAALKGVDGLSTGAPSRSQRCGQLACSSVDLVRGFYATSRGAPGASPWPPAKRP
jgi:thiaminase/transcriptional activator TenA